MEPSTSSLPVQPQTRPPRVVYTVIEREGSRSFWLRVGAAWTNRDGSVTLRLDALPVNGVLQIRDAEERRDARSTP